MTVFDVVKEAGSPYVAIVKECKGIRAGDTLELTMSPAASNAQGEPIIAGIEIVAE